MPGLYLDHVSTLSCVERLDVIRSMTRKALVLWDTPDVPIPDDYSILERSLKVDGMPLPFSNLAAIGHPSLRLVERAPSVLAGDPASVEVILKYEHVLDGANQLLTDVNDPSYPNPLQAAGIIYGNGKCSIVEKTTNFYRPYGDPNKERVQILVAHQYDPQAEPGIAAMNSMMLHPDTNPFTIYQGGEVSIPFPQANFKLQGVLRTGNPFLTADRFVARINEGPWLGKAPLTWICSEVSWDVLDTLLKTYKFQFEFQYNVDTWDPTAVFTDHRTGRAPTGIKKATHLDLDNVMSWVYNSLENPQPAGYWQVPALQRVNFPAMFLALFEGAA